jgi:hypothetical protein
MHISRPDTSEPSYSAPLPVKLKPRQWPGIRASSASLESSAITGVLRPGRELSAGEFLWTVAPSFSVAWLRPS